MPGGNDIVHPACGMTWDELATPFDLAREIRSLIEKGLESEAEIMLEELRRLIMSRWTDFPRLGEREWARFRVLAVNGPPSGL